MSCSPRKQSFRVLAPLYPFQVQLLQTIAFLQFQKKCLNLSSSSSAVNTSQFDNCQSFCCHVCPENKISDFWRRSTLSKYNYYKLLLFCNFKRFEAEQFFYSNQSLEINLSSSSAVNTSQFDNCQSFCCHVCPENKVSEFWRRSTFSKYNYYKLLLFCNFKKKCLNLSSSSSAVNTSQFDNCQSFCCHVCPENKISDFWRRSTISKYNHYKLLLFCNFKKMFESKQFFFSGQYLTV